MTFNNTHTNNYNDHRAFTKELELKLNENETLAKQNKKLIGVLDEKIKALMR